MPIKVHVRCPNANDEQCDYPSCTCHETVRIPSHLKQLTTRELVAELNDRIRLGYGVEQVPLNYWNILSEQAQKMCAIQEPEFPNVGEACGC